MAQKYIVTKDNVIFGNVSYHSELANRYPNSIVLGGGLWKVDVATKRVYLYYKSMNYGAPKRVDVVNALKIGQISPWLKNYSFFFCTHEKFNDAVKEVDTNYAESLVRYASVSKPAKS